MRGVEDILVDKINDAFRLIKRCYQYRPCRGEKILDPKGRGWHSGQ